MFLGTLWLSLIRCRLECRDRPLPRKTAAQPLAASIHSRPIPPGVPMSGSGSEYDWKRNWVRIAWFVTIAIVALAVAALVSGRGFSLGVGGGSGPQLSVGTGSIGQPVGQTELADAQPELQAQSSAAADNLAFQPSAAQTADADLNGSWFSVGGATYQIVQQGAAAAITETDPFGNITAYGEGIVEGRTFSFQFTTAAFTTGSGSLTLDAAGTTLQGSFSDAFGTRAASLQR